MKNFKTFNEALEWQKKGQTDLETGSELIDRVQFSLGEVVWLAIASNYYLDDYEESVTQYGVTASGEWAAVSGGHCSCYGWEEMSEGDITYYPTLEVLLRADKYARVVIDHREVLVEALPFLDSAWYGLKGLS